MKLFPVIILFIIICITPFVSRFLKLHIVKSRIKASGNKARLTIAKIALDANGIKWRRHLFLILVLTLMIGIIIGFCINDRTEKHMKAESDVDETQKTDDDVEEKKHYTFIIKDITYLEAVAECKRVNKNLVVFETLNEYETVTEMLTEQGFEGYYFYVGVCRNNSSELYYYCDNELSQYGNSINNEPYWRPGEPSFYDYNSGVEELYGEIYFSKDYGRWVMNDIPNDILTDWDIFDGKVGYIIEE